MATRAFHDALMKTHNFGSQAFTSRTLFSDSFIGAAPSLAIATPFAYQYFLRYGRIAYCDAGATLGEDYSAGPETGQFVSSNFGATFGEDRAKTTGSGNFLKNDELKYSMKQYDIKLKPLFSAFHWKTLCLTSLRSFLLNYLPLLEPGANIDDDDEEEEEKEEEEKLPLDLVNPFYQSLKQIILEVFAAFNVSLRAVYPQLSVDVKETSVATIHRILDRVAYHYASRRIARKLIKGIYSSAVGRELPCGTFCFRVSRTTLRGHLLGVLASWSIQVGINSYAFLYCVTKSKKESDEETDVMKQVRILGKKVGGANVRSISSLVFAAIAAGIGAGIGVKLGRPSTGQWIGCALGNFAGPFIVEYCFGML